MLIYGILLVFISLMSIAYFKLREEMTYFKEDVKEDSLESLALIDENIDSISKLSNRVKKLEQDKSNNKTVKRTKKKVVKKKPTTKKKKTSKRSK